jgi:hypothetical protein
MNSPKPEESDTRKFTSDVVEDLLRRNLKGGFNPPDDAGCRRLANAFNRSYEREIFGEVYDSPHMLWRHNIGGRANIRRRWHNFVRELAETIQTELALANRYTSVGLSDDGPVLRVTVEVIFMITGEKPSPPSVAREVWRQQKA